MKRLAQMRLIHTVHGGGNRVADWREEAGLELLPDLLVNEAGLPDFAMLRALLEMRACLGVDVARRAAQRAEPEAVQALQSVVDQMRRRPNDIEHLQGEVQGFWARLVRMADNPVYVMASIHWTCPGGAMAPTCGTCSATSCARSTSTRPLSRPAVVVIRSVRPSTRASWCRWRRSRSRRRPVATSSARP